MNRFSTLIFILLSVLSQSLHASFSLPEGMVWETNIADPIYASPDAEIGGTLRSYLRSFPLTLRSAGPDSNDGFATYTSAFTLSLISLHPETLKPVPSLATHWAYHPDGKTVYFKLDPKARWSDGKQVTADDYVFTQTFSRSKHIVDPFKNDYFTNRIINIKKHDEFVVSVEASSAKPQEEIMFNVAVSPTPEHFHVLNENWVRSYNWKIEPTTGPYDITKVRKGKYIRFSRKLDWWANDNKYFKYRFNPKIIHLKVIRDDNIAFRYFLRGELDVFFSSATNIWHERSKHKLYKNGYIHRLWFYNLGPVSPQGLYMNQDDELLSDLNVRKGIAHSLAVDKMIATVMRGEYARSQHFYQGYGDYSNKDLKAPEFDLDKATKYFAAAGWIKRGPDGILVNNGKRLSVNLSYGSEKLTKRLVVFKQEAKKAGLELELELMDSASSFKKVLEKKHQIAFGNWSTGVVPSYWQMWHSDNAHKPQTVNTTNMDDPVLDKLIDRYRDSVSKQERVKLGLNIQQIIHDKTVFIPTLKGNMNREAYWRWMKYPAGLGTSRTAALLTPIPWTDWTFWIDVAGKQTTKDALSDGEVFEPVTIIDTTYKAVQ